MSEDMFNEKWEALEKRITAITIIGQKDLLTTKEAALYMGLGIRTVQSITKDIPHYKSKGGKDNYFKKSDLDAWMLGTRIKTREEIKKEARHKVILSHIA